MYFHISTIPARNRKVTDGCNSSRLAGMKDYLNKKLTSLVVTQFVHYWYFYIGAFICLYLTHNIQSELPFIAKDLAEKISKGISIPVGHLFLLALGIIVFRTSSRLLFFYPARVLQKILRFDLMKKLEKVSPSRYKDYPKGQIFQIIGGDLEHVRALIGFALLQIANIIIALSILVPKLLSFNKELFIALLPMFVAFIIFSAIVSTNRKFYRKTQDLQGEVQNIIIETYAGKKTIKNFHAEKAFIDLFAKKSLEELDNFYEAGKRVGISIPLMPTGVGLSLIWGAYIIFTEQLGASSLILFSGFVYLFLEPIMFLAWIGVVFTRSAGAWARVRELVAVLDKESELETMLKREFSFKEKSESFELQLPFWDNDINLKIWKDEKNAIVGKTGCGKSELLVKISEVLKMQGRSTSYVAQDPYLYNGTILENLALGRDFTEEQLSRAYELLKIFGLDYLASDRKSLFNLVVGENGKRLSGGQIKRVSLIKSLLFESEFIIWDDPFSSVDVVLEREILSQLNAMKIFEGRTLIMSTHRYTTAVQCDHLSLICESEGLREESKVVDFTQKQEGGIYEHFRKQLI
ncbi:ABC transporter transmembrane domain-containing protein [Halobacteriovorax sp. ZH4_bin.1]|uniref:ABC transporter transmembrane domain-containing protein n=1 Tax=unclassified Halobacteriovorax TaxID=2639665 RepID=UPI00372424A8